MSEVSEVTTPDVTSDKPARKRESTKAIPFSNIHVTFAKAKGIDVTRAAKLNRSYIRANYDQLLKLWPALKASHKINRDNNRYPSDIPANVAKMITSRSIPATKR